MKRTTEHNYMRMIERMLKAGELNPHELATLDVMHDPWCDALPPTNEYCNCNPKITVRPGLQPPLNDPSKILFPPPRKR